MVPITLSQNPKVPTQVQQIWEPLIWIVCLICPVSGSALSGRLLGKNDQNKIHCNKENYCLMLPIKSSASFFIKNALWALLWGLLSSDFCPYNTPLLHTEKCRISSSLVVIVRVVYSVHCA